MPARRPSAIAPARPLPTSNAPTAIYRQHHEVSAPQIDAHAFRQAWRVASRLDGLLEAERIDREQWDAALTWRRWAEMITPSRVQAWDVRVDAQLMPNDAGMLYRVQTTKKLRDVADALGAIRIKLLEWVVVRDLPWTEIGRFMRVSDKTARDRAVEALTALADFYAGRPVAPEPVIRFRNEPGRL
jgi:hypothetical protein